MVGGGGTGAEARVAWPWHGVKRCRAGVIPSDRVARVWRTFGGGKPYKAGGKRKPPARFPKRAAIAASMAALEPDITFLYPVRAIVRFPFPSDTFVNRMSISAIHRGVSGLAVAIGQFPQLGRKFLANLCVSRRRICHCVCNFHIRTPKRHNPGIGLVR